MLADWSRVVEVPRDEAVDRLVQWLSSDKVRPQKLAQAAKGETPVVREGLRGLMVKGGMNSEASRIPPARSDLARRRALVAA